MLDRLLTRGYTPLIRSFHASISSPPVSRSDNDCPGGNPGGDVKNLLIRILESKLPEHVFWRMFSIGLVVYAVAVAGYTTWAHFHNTPQHRPLYLIPFEALAFAAMCEWVRSHDAK